MRIDTGITRSASKRFIIPIRNMLVRFSVPVALSEAEVYQMNQRGPLANPNQEIVGLYVSVDEVFRMNIFDAGEHLIGQHQGSFERETSPTIIEQIF